MAGDLRDWVLVVEDEPDIREIMCMILEARGITAVGAADGLEALGILAVEAPPDVVILDLMMPRMDGWQFREAQRGDARLAHVPVLVISGDGRVDAKAASLDAAGAVRKPVDMDHLLAMVETHRRRRAGEARP